MNTPDTNKNTDSLDNSLVNNNTPDTEEWEKEFYEQFTNNGTIWNRGKMELTLDSIKQFITKTRTSRDTYWKERVRKEKNEVICFLDELLREMFSNLPDNSDERLGAITALTHIRNEIDAYCLTPTPITNEDNLK